MLSIVRQELVAPDVRGAPCSQFLLDAMQKLLGMGGQNNLLADLRSLVGSQYSSHIHTPTPDRYELSAERQRP
ncbi:hypothetical protein WK29_02610 [Burkholderia vietnamiensis]|nr:hypothetical protein WK29_02610 [Burkholderia vietnamiensis]